MSTTSYMGAHLIMAIDTRAQRLLPWRRKRDSNPRELYCMQIKLTFAPTCAQGKPLQPLEYSSANLCELLPPMGNEKSTAIKGEVGAY